MADGKFVLVLLLTVVVSLLACRGDSGLHVRRFYSPQYPRYARIHHLDGVVTVNVQVAADGKVVSAKGVGPHPVLVKAAERNAFRWLFEPAKRGPLPAATTVIYEFRLTGQPTLVGLTTAEFEPPDRVLVVDQPVSKSAPHFSPERIVDYDSERPTLLLFLRDCYSKHCADQAERSIDQVPLGKLTDCYSKHCEQGPKDEH